VGLELPASVIDIVEGLQWLRLDAAGFANFLTGQDAAFKRAAKYLYRTPARGNPLRESICLSLPLFCEIKLDTR
jgi:hypothetical protein